MSTLLLAVRQRARPALISQQKLNLLSAFFGLPRNGAIALANDDDDNNKWRSTTQRRRRSSSCIVASTSQSTVSSPKLPPTTETILESLTTSMTTTTIRTLSGSSSSSSGEDEYKSEDDDDVVRFVYIEADGREKDVEAPLHRHLLDVAHDNHVELEGACGGELACSTCHLIFEQHIYDMLPPKSDEEEDMLDLAFEVTPTSRLGCQVRVTKDFEGMKVRIPDDGF